MDKAAMIVAFAELGVEIAEKLAWLFQHQGTTFTDDEKAQINLELEKARARFVVALTQTT